MLRKKTNDENSTTVTSVEPVTRVQKVKSYVYKNKILLAIIACFFVYICAVNGSVSDALDERNSLNAAIEDQSRQYEELLSGYHDLEAELEDLQEQQKDMEELKGLYAQLQDDFDSLSAENQKLKTENENLSGQIASLQTQADSANTASLSNDVGMTGTAAYGGDNGGMVWLSATGSKYHSIPDCGNMDPNKARQIARSSAEAQGYEACSKCW